MDAERRHFFRVMAHLPVGCMPVGVEQGSPFACETLDLSAGGVRLLMKPCLAAGQQVRLALQLTEGGGLTLMLDAVVVRSVAAAKGGRHICALRFENLDARTEQRLVQAVFAAERRELERYERLRSTIWVPVVCTLPGGAELRGRTLDISTEELRFVCATAVVPGTRVAVVLEPGEDESFPLTADGCVTSSLSEGEGRVTVTVAFEGLDRRVRAALVKRAREQDQREAAARLAEQS
jgi:c-di-GMP-binding flagellar brake protein YcgR